MNQHALDFLMQITNEALLLTIVICAPSLLLSMLLGLVISLIQAVTQIQEQTLTFVPKMILIFASLAALGPWIGNTMLKFAVKCFEGFSLVIY
jgi:flagellar biosynthetic protein FliQ